MGKDIWTVFLLLLPLASASADATTLSRVSTAYQRWSDSNRDQFRAFADEHSGNIVARLGEEARQRLFSMEAIEKIRASLDALHPSHLDEAAVSISSAHDSDDAFDGVRLTSPFLSATLPNVTSDLVALHILGEVTAEVRQIVQTEVPDASGLIQALFLTAIDVTELNIREILIMVTTCLAELQAELNPVPEYHPDHTVREGDGSPVLYQNVVQDNWAGTLGSSRVIKTYYPRTRSGVVNIVKKARREDARVRASGMKHSWSHWVWGVDNQFEEVERNRCYCRGESGDVDYYIAMVPYELSDPLFIVRSNLTAWRSSASELTFVEQASEPWIDPDGSEHTTVKVGGAAISEFLTEWCVENGWVLPAEPMISYFTLSGVVSTNAHGSGRRHGPVSDYVVAMEYVDEKGEIQTVTDPFELDATAGSYGLFGIILSLTFRVDRISYAVFQPSLVINQVRPTEDYFPRPPNPLPADVENFMQNYYYTSWYIRTNNDKMGNPPFDIIQQVWDDNGREEDARPIFSPATDVYENHKRYLYTLLDDIFKDVMDDEGVRSYLYWINTAVNAQVDGYLDANDPLGPLFPAPAVTTSTAEAIHWLRGWHAFKFRSLEFDIPVRDDGTGNPDWTTVTEVFWLFQDLINSAEPYGVYFTDSLTELRVYGNSSRLLDYTWGNRFGTVMLSIGATMTIPLDVWDELKSELAFRFNRFDTGPGLPKVRYHIGKETPTFVSGIGTSSADYFRATMGEQIDLFKDAYATIVESRGSSVEDSLRRFSTKFFDEALLDCDGGRRPGRCRRGWPWWGED